VETSEGMLGASATEPQRPILTSDEYRLVDLVRMLARHRQATVAFPLLVALLTAIVSFLVPLTYTATTTFVPEGSPQGRLPSSLAGLATQFGIALGSEASKSPKFYAEVVRSRGLMEHVLLSRYVDPRRQQRAGNQQLRCAHWRVIDPHSFR